jgi:hypothetical protein
MTKSSADFITEIKPLWVGDLGTRPKKNIWVGLGLVLPFITRDFCLSAVGYSAKKNKNL